MLHYDRIDISEEIDVSKTSEPEECDLSQLFFSDKRFKFSTNVSNWCHDVLMTSMNLRNNSVLNICGADYCCINSRISGSETINLMRKINSSEKSRTLYV